MLRADRLGADLTEEVDLDRRVDGDHVVVLADDVRIVDVFDRQDLDGRVIVDIIINALRTEGKRRDGLAAMDLLFAVVDRAALDELDHGVGEHLGVDAEVVLALERHAGRVRDRADAELQARAVRNALGNEAADRLAHVVKLHRRQHRQRHRHFPERGGRDGIGCRQRGHGAFRRENHGLTAPYRTFCLIYDTIFGMLSGKTCYNSQGVLCIQPPTAL